MSDQYEVYALKYAQRDARARDHFVLGDMHDAPMPMDYFVWVIRSEARTVVVDIGFTAAEAARRRREHLRCPAESLRLLAIPPDALAADGAVGTIQAMSQ